VGRQHRPGVGAGAARRAMAPGRHTLFYLSRTGAAIAPLAAAQSAASPRRRREPAALPAPRPSARRALGALAAMPSYAIETGAREPRERGACRRGRRIRRCPRRPPSPPPREAAGLSGQLSGPRNERPQIPAPAGGMRERGDGARARIVRHRRARRGPHRPPPAPPSPARHRQPGPQNAGHRPGRSGHGRRERGARAESAPHRARGAPPTPPPLPPPPVLPRR